MMVSSQINKAFTGGNMAQFNNFNKPPLSRNLSKTDLGGVIFGCKNETKEECLSKGLFGLPAGHFSYVRNIQPGLPLFLFNYSDRKLYGVFEAASSGQMNINPYAWTKDGSGRTAFPAQVQVLLRVFCQPLPEDQFSTIIKDNYYRHGHFWFELDHSQASSLNSRFSSRVVVTVPRSLPKPKQIYLPKTSEAREAIKPPKVELSSDHLNSDGNYGGPDSSVCQDGDYLSSESSLRSEHDEKEIMFQKLQKLALESVSSHDTQEWEIMNKNETITLDDERKMEEVLQDDDVLNSPVTQLMKEVKELKAFKQDQTLKTDLMEQKLIELEAENQWLKKRCEMLQSSDRSEFLSASEEIESLNEQHFDWDSIFIAGGYDGNAFLSSAVSYSLSRDTVKTLRPMLSVCAYASVAKLNDSFYVVGGGDGSQWYDTVESYNMLNDEWTLQPTLKDANGSLATATVGNKIFSMGGGDGRVCFSDMQMLDPDVGRWISGRSMRQKRFALGAVTLNNAIYVVGGYDGSEYLRSGERFDPREHAWSNIENMNSKRGCHSLAVLNEKIYALGGFDGNNMVSSVEVFDPRLGRWMPEASMNYARGYAPAVALMGALYVIGGVVDEEALPESIERYEEGSGWQVSNLKGIGKRCYAAVMAL